MTTTRLPNALPRPRRRLGSCSVPRLGPRLGRRRVCAGLAVLFLLACAAATSAPAALAASYTRISGEGSSWAGNALLQWNADVQSQGVTIDYNPNGSSTGRKDFATGAADFAVSEIPFKGDTADPQDNNYPGFSYSLLPVVAGGTAFMYNLQVNGSQFESLQLSQAALAGIFSGQITTWNDPAIAATNPGVALPAQQITVVVRSDGSGATAQFTLWMLRQFPQDWQALCKTTGCNPNAATSYYPYQGLSNFTAQSGSLGVTTYVSQTPYSINYDEYSYALGAGLPVAGIQNAHGFFTKPTQTAVAVALLKAQINNTPGDNYLSQDLSQVYEYQDPRTYPISAYSYLVVPAATHDSFDDSKGATLGYYSTYDLCQGQQSMGALGYSPLPMNLVLAAMDQVLKIPGVDSATQGVIADTKNGVANGNANPCNNPTFKPGDDPAHNILIDTAPFPDGCDSACQAPWLTKAAATNGGTTGKSGGVKGKVKQSGSQSGATAAPSTGAAGSGGSAGTTGTTDSTGTTAAAGTTTSGTTTGGAPGGGAAAPSCDPDTGVCGAIGTVGQTTGTTSDATTLTASPAVISGERPWGGPQLAIAICVLLGLLLVVGPAVVSGQLNRRPAGPAAARRTAGSGAAASPTAKPDEPAAAPMDGPGNA